jgi:hypothetical protein
LIQVAYGEKARWTHKMPDLQGLRAAASVEFSNAAIARQHAADGAFHASVWLFLLKPPIYCNNQCYGLDYKESKGKPSMKISDYGIIAYRKRFIYWPALAQSMAV